MSSINSNGPIYLNDLGSFAFNGELRKACKAGSGSLQIIVGEKKYEIEVQKGSFFGIGRPRITSMKLIPNTSTQLLTGNSTQSVSFDKFKAIKLGCICGKEDLEKAIKQSQAAKIKEEAGNLAGLLKKSGEDFQKINSALEKIPEALLPDVLRHGMGNKQTLLHAAAESPNGAAFFEAVVKQLNNETELKALLAMKNGKDNTGNTPLHFAAQCGNVDFLNAVAGKLEKDQLKDLLAMGNENNNTGNTPLHLAVGTPNGAAFFKAVAEQLKNETDLKAFLGMGDNDNNTPLHVAAIKAGPNGAAFFDAVAEQLKDKTDLKAFLGMGDNGGNTPLHVAAGWGNVNFLNAVAGKLEKADLKELLAMGNEENGTGPTPLHFAAQCRNVDFLKAVAGKLEKAELKALLAMTDNDGQTPLQLAAKAENTGFLKTAMDAFKDNDKQLQTEILKDIINACIEEKEEEEGIKLLAKVIEGYDDTTKNDLLNLLKNDDKYNSLEEAMELNRKNQ